MEYASCFVGQAWEPKRRKCNIIKPTIVGLAKMLAYGDFLEARAAQRNETIFTVLDEEIENYPYSKKSKTKVRDIAVSKNHNIKSLLVFVEHYK